MKSTGKVIGIILVLGAGIFMSLQGFGWSPWNLLFGPQAMIHAQQDDYPEKMKIFIKRELPIYYPKLIGWLGKDNAQRIFYQNQYGETRYFDIADNKKEGVVIKMSDTVLAGNESIKMNFYLIDSNRDSYPDIYLNDKGPDYEENKEVWKVMWYTLLAAAIKNSGCCKD